MISIRLKQLLSNTLKVLAAVICICSASHSYAQHLGDDDTILVEKSPSLFSSYKTALKVFSKELLGAYMADFFSDSKNCTDTVIRNFSELADRTQYKVNLNQDKVELKLSLSF